MERLHNSRLTNIFLLAFFLTLLCLVPFISTSMRTSYLYFLLNLLVIVLGAKAGFLTAISKPREDRKPSHVFVSPATNYAETLTANITTTTTTNVSMFMGRPPIPTTTVDKKKKKKSNVTRSAKRVHSLRPSLFFIGSGEPEEEEEVEKEEEMAAERRGEEDVGELSKQELFSKAEMLIGNFYKQLKMQRENSWQKLQGL